MALGFIVVVMIGLPLGIEAMREDLITQRITPDAAQGFVIQTIFINICVIGAALFLILTRRNQT